MGNGDGVVYTLYGLYHPLTSELRYIGQTKFKPRRRLLGHIQSANTRTQDNTPITNWVRKLLRSDLKPVQKVLYQTVSKDEIDRMEIATIRGCREREFRLLNIHRGGDCPRGHRRSEDSKRRTSETLKERYRHKTHHLKGKTLEPEHRDKVLEAAARGNQNWPEERKRKSSENLRKWLDDPVLKAEMNRRRVESRMRNKELRMLH